jgi:dual specificity tyrosine-phosphorylation-regulated kinase 2/3/4
MRMFLTVRATGTPFSARKERIQALPDEVKVAPPPPVAPHPPDKENTEENALAVKPPRGPPLSARPLNPRFARQVPSVPNSAAALSPVVPNAPIGPEEAREKYAAFLNSHELREIVDYDEIYYLGQPTRKVRLSVTTALNSGFDDCQCHYRASVGDHIAYRYEIRAILGKGAFGQVIRCYDHKAKTHVAIKALVNTELMHEQGRIECSILQYLNKIDPAHSHHLVHALEFFVFRRHICIAFEILGPNLYEYSRSMRFRPMPPRQVKPAARQILDGLAFCHGHSVVHCDMKPENIVVDASGFPNVKIIDFGSSCFAGRQRYEYIQSRFYRAPEVILGVKYGPPMDIWSFACSVIEMITGKPVFPGDDEYDQLDLLMQVLGPVPEQLRERSSRKKEFFTPDGAFIPTKGAKIRKPGSVTLEAITRIGDPLLLDLLKKCFEWKQEDRITAQDALMHPWFTVKEVVTGRASISHGFPELVRGQ